jgi:hypothetical protein
MIDIATLLAEHPHGVVSSALALIADNWHDANFTRWVDPQRILAEAWHDGRLAEAKRRLAAGEKAPAIRVVGYRWNSDWTIYDPSDGIHRTVAARDAGRKVKARITGYYRLKPGEFVVWREQVWKRANGGAPDYVVSEVSTEEHAVLAALGVPERKERTD